MGGDFSGLLGGVLNGDTRRSEEARFALGAASVFDSWNARLAGFTGILGLSARLAGGGKEALLALRSDGLSRIANLAECNSPGDKLPGVFEVGVPATELRDSRGGSDSCKAPVSRPKPNGLRETRFPSSASSSGDSTSPRGGDRGESTVNVGANCGEDRKLNDIGRPCRLPEEPLARDASPFAKPPVRCLYN